MFYRCLMVSLIGFRYGPILALQIMRSENPRVMCMFQLRACMGWRLKTGVVFGSSDILVRKATIWTSLTCGKRLSQYDNDMEARSRWVERRKRRLSDTHLTHLWKVKNMCFRLSSLFLFPNANTRLYTSVWHRRHATRRHRYFRQC